MKRILIGIEIRPRFGLILNILRAMATGKNLGLETEITEHNVRQMMSALNSENGRSEIIPFTKHQAGE